MTTETVEPLSASRVTMSSFAASSRLEMVEEDSVIRVGQEAEVALSDAYARPKKGTALTELPPGFDDTFEVTGWEIYDRSLAVLAKDGRVVLALDNREKTTDEVAESIVQRYVSLHGEPMVTVENERVRYQFWQEGTVVLMISDVQGQSGRTLTVALGLQLPMERLRMSPEYAREDADEALAILRRSAGNETKSDPSASE